MDQTKRTYRMRTSYRKQIDQLDGHVTTMGRATVGAKVASRAIIAKVLRVLMAVSCGGGFDTENAAALTMGLVQETGAERVQPPTTR